MNRSTTAPLLRTQFTLWCRTMGVAEAHSPNDVGAYLLDNSQTGWQIHLQHADGAISKPFSDARHTAPVMFDILRFAIASAGLYAKQEFTIVIGVDNDDSEMSVATVYRGVMTEDDGIERFITERVDEENGEPDNAGTSPEMISEQYTIIVASQGGLKE